MFCPVFLRDIDTEPKVWERHWSLAPVFWLAMQFEQARIFLLSMAGHECMFRFRITGRLP